ncbi:hypothetical protein ACOMCU_01380 [Lysinibacillus sp. UGB7]|uniref:hypothetical protein n=1 Tax=Lysinibacillus TaxID=400634 RepID=UPI0018CFA69C|nr:hypothetical protein [Lysinibacillus sphaericus]MBG9693196.1 hypothetical protein [Lysinibacillus sphaericus]
MESNQNQIKINDEVIFRIKPYYYGALGEYHDGIVTAIYENGVLVHYLYGYKSESDIVKWGDIMIVGDKENGEYFRICGYSGRGRILNKEILNT